jgi:hypothetical protein
MTTSIILPSNKRKCQRRAHYSTAPFLFIILFSSLLAPNQAFISSNCNFNIPSTSTTTRPRSHHQSAAAFVPLQVSLSTDDAYFHPYIPADDKDQQDETYAVNLQIAELAKAASLRNKTAARMAYDLLISQRYPDTVAYNSVLKALAKTSSLYNKPSATLAQELLEEMEELNAIQVENNRKWYQRLRADNLTQDELSIGPPRVRVKPNVRSYSTVMDAWGKQTNPAAAQKAQDLLETLQAKHEATGDVAVQPNAITYNTVINAWAKAGANVEGALHCERLLDEMYNLADVISYNAVLHAWARSGLPNAGERAELLLRRMTMVEPNGRTYTTVMDAWSRSYEACPDSAQRAHALLTEMERLAVQNGDDRMKPNYISYSTVVNAYALSKTEPLKAHKAFSILQRMLRMSKTDSNVRPNRVTYNSVLNACATSCPIAVKDYLHEHNWDQKVPTLPDMVRTIYAQLLETESLRPDHFTFGTVLKAVANLFWGEPDQVEFGAKVFQEACRRGQVSFGVLSQLRQAMPAEVFRELLPQKAICDERPEALLNHIPKSWTANVREESRRRPNQTIMRRREQWK